MISNSRSQHESNNVWTEDLSILVISTQAFCTRLKLALKNASDKFYKSEIRIKLAENVDDIVASVQPDTMVDYVVVVVDTSLPGSLISCKNNLSLLKPNFVATRICLVNGSAFSGGTSAAKTLTVMADDYNIPYVNAEIMDNSSCKTTGERIMKLAAASTGYKTGIPVVIPTPKDLGFL